VRLVPERLRRDRGRETSVEDYVGGALTFRRRLTGTAIVAVVAVVAVSAGLAFQQYRHAQHSNLGELRSRAVIAAAVVDTSFAGDVSTLESVGAAPSFANVDRPTMEAYLRRLRPTLGRTFNAGIGWIDPNGFVELSSLGPASHRDVSDRTYFKQVIATGRPYVSGGLIARSTHQPVITVAVPTRLADGSLSGVLVGGVRLQTLRQSRQQLELGYQGLEVVDRNGRLLLSGFSRSQNPDLVRRLRTGGTGVLTNTTGLDGAHGHVVAYATAAIPDWLIVIDRPRSSVDVAAFNSLVLQLASVGAVALVVFGLVALVVRRSRREHELQESRARAWRDLIRALGAAATADEVSAAVLSSLTAAFPDALVVVVLEGIDGTRQTRANGAGWPRVVADELLMAEIERRAVSRRQTVVLERTPVLRPAVAISGRRLRALHAAPLLGVDGGLIGGIALLVGSEEPLDASEWALFGSFVEQTARAFVRTRRSELDHDLAVRLQLSLLPEALPEVPGVRLTGHYRAGAEGLVVGGDWYDAVRRRDGVIVLCVGDVIGRGIGAATLMGRLRDAFRAHTFETAAPGEIVRRLLQHESGSEMMVTLACVSLDPYSGELAYSSAGHPPPLLVDEDTGEVTRLDGAAAPPLGVAEPSSIREERLRASERATLVLYTDGLIERRGDNIDHGIDVLGQVVAAEPSRPIARILAEVTEVLGPGTDDVAFLVARVDAAATPFEVEIPADPTELAGLRHRLRPWLSRRRFDRTEVDEILLAVSEACNNAIEHAYRDELGSVRLRLDDDGETLRAVVRDTGRWRDGDSGADRGRGLVIMRTVMDRIDVETGDHGTQVVLERVHRRAANPARV
jgi:anti-sigma regulatory factor (Ser/Thr protein kinase)